MIFIDGLKVLRKGVGACTVVGKDVRTIIYFIRDRFPFAFEEEVRQKSFTVMINFISNVSKVFLSCRTNPYLNRLFVFTKLFQQYRVITISDFPLKGLFSYRFC